MKFNKIILFSLLLLAIISFGAVSAADDANSTDDLTVQTKEDNDCLALDNIDEISQANDVTLKEESTPIVITNDTFNNYFDEEGRISDSVSEGSTLDFQGQIIASDNIRAIYINKSVNIMSSTKDATITLNSVNGTFGNEHITSRFIVDNVSSITIRDVTFNRTQMIIHDSCNVILDNIQVISDNYTILEDHSLQTLVNPLLKFENIDGFNLKNIYINVYNIGSRLLHCIDVKNAVFDNNTFIIRSDDYELDKRIEGIFRFSNSVPEYGRESMGNVSRVVDTSVIFTNNYINVNSDNSFLSSYIAACNILFENNTLKQPEIENINQAIRFSLSGFKNSSIIVKNNFFPYLGVSGNATVFNNTCHYAIGCRDSVVYNNIIGNNMGFYTVPDAHIYNSIFFNNTVNGVVKINGDNTILENSKMKGIIFSKGKNITVKNNQITGNIDVASTETYINNNTIVGNVLIETGGNCEIRYNSINGPITIESSGCLVDYNVINAFDSDYAVYIKNGKNYINNEVSDNEIYSRWYCGDNAVSHDENYLNFIEYNTPANQISMSVENTVDVFDYGENTTINVNVPNVKGTVTIDVNGEKYTVNLVNGDASHVLTKYSLGFNHVTVIYYDIFDDVWAIGYANFTVNKVKHCPVELVYGRMSDGVPSNINFILPEDADGTVTVSLTDGIYSVDIEQDAKGGNNIITLPGLPEGDYTITATFTSIKYVTNSSTGIISFIHNPVYKLTASDVVMDYKDGSKFKVLVTKDGKAVVGETVKITFNGKTSNVKTDKNGYATLTLDAAPKSYTIKAVYNGVTKSSKVTIKNILKAKNLSKKKSKTVKFQATLKTSKGKAIVGKKITFKLKGKTYSAKTNKKGVTTISIKNLKVGKYTIISKYGSCTVKNTITIKK